MTLRIAQQKILVALLLALLAATAYLPVLRCGFVEYDDTDYVTENLEVQNGLTLQSVTWAFTTSHAANWHPLTWLSHMLDVQWYGLHPAGHHVTSLVFHALNTTLLFLLLMQMTGALWRSALVATLFALHPTHVESVAWVSERKDVLSTFFALLSLWAYAKYAEKKSRAAPGALPPYVLALVFFALGLMSKPMLVTLPFLLLLLDFWPLARLQPPLANPKRWIPLAVEKIPFFLLTAISSAATFLIQRAGGATVSTAEFPLSGRLANVLVAYVRYLGKLFWPDHLAVFYPRPAEWPLGQVAGSALILLLITAFALRLALSWRYLAVGWFWFLGTLVPVIGLVQVGEQSMADRYAYIPSIGIFIALVWGIGEIVSHYQSLKFPVGAAAICVLAALFLGTWQQARYWETTETLFRQAVKATSDNPTAEEALAAALSKAGNLDEAEPHALKALLLKPNFPEAIITYSVILARQGNFSEARTRLSEVLRRGSPDPNARFAMAQACASSGDVAEAIHQYQEGLRLKPENADALNNLAWIRAAQADPAFRNGAEAVQLAQKACELTHFRRPMLVGTLAAAYAEAGRFPEAVAAAQKARDLCLAEGKRELADRNQELLELYQAGKPYHEPAQPTAATPPTPAAAP